MQQAQSAHVIQRKADTPIIRPANAPSDWDNRPKGGIVLIQHEIPIGAIDSNNQNFKLRFIPESGTLNVRINGLKENGFDVAQDILTLSYAPEAGEQLEVDYTTLSAPQNITSVTSGSAIRLDGIIIQ